MFGVMLEPHCRGWQSVVSEWVSNDAGIVGEKCELDALSQIHFMFTAGEEAP